MKRKLWTIYFCSKATPIGCSSKGWPSYFHSMPNRHCRVDGRLMSDLSVLNSIPAMNILPSLHYMVPPTPRPTMWLKIFCTPTSVFNKTLWRDIIMILGDFNEQIGKDNDTWTSTLRKFCIRQKKRNGKQMLERGAWWSLPHSSISQRFTNQSGTTQMVSPGLLLIIYSLTILGVQQS